VDIQRIRREVAQAASTFGWVEVRPTTDGAGVFVKAVLQTSPGNQYVISINFPNYPFQMPKVVVSQPAIRAWAPHRYSDGNICYLHPSMWNPGQHDVTFVLARVAKWLNKYEVWCAKTKWPGAQMAH
jgi:ubiquitin-protein ligase